MKIHSAVFFAVEIMLCFSLPIKQRNSRAYRKIKRDIASDAVK
ncbi:MAG: hypothetical protein RSE36_05740 [Oscillospiraceae bacterium]